MDSYQEKLEREKHWYTEQESPQGHFLNSWPFHSEKRNDFSYVLPKVQMARAVERVIPKFSRPKILIAPLGTGDDFQYVAHLSDAITGLDISPEAVVQPGISFVLSLIHFIQSATSLGWESKCSAMSPEELTVKHRLFLFGSPAPCGAAALLTLPFLPPVFPTIVSRFGWQKQITSLLVRSLRCQCSSTLHGFACSTDGSPWRSFPDPFEYSPESCSDASRSCWRPNLAGC